MNLRRNLILLELPIIISYLVIILFSIEIQPLNIIFGILCVLIFPGLNLLNIIKPQFTLMAKLGYAIIVSLAIENIAMFFSYFLFFNFHTYSDPLREGLIFNQFLLITAIQFVNIILVLIFSLKSLRNDKFFDTNTNKNYLIQNYNIKESFNVRSFIGVFCYFISLILLCISAYFSEVPENNTFNMNLIDYRSYFTFFLRVPLIFYIFLTLTILLLAYIMIYTKNHYIILFSLSGFIYCLWILPYLQIGNYFSRDAFLLYKACDSYFIHGIGPYYGHSIAIYGVDALRYSSGVFTAIIIIISTNVEINYALWYLFPIIYFFLPFFFYDVSKKLLNKNKARKNISILFTFFALLAPQFLKSGHTPGTGILGIILFFMLVIAFFNFMHNKSNNKVRDYIFIIILYVFLCLTHTEECIYFLILMALYIIIFSFIKLIVNREVIPSSIYQNELKNPLKKEWKTSLQIINQKSKHKIIRNSFYKISIFLIPFCFIFYLTMEIFGWFHIYMNQVIRGIPFLGFIPELYFSSRKQIPFLLTGNISYSVFVLWVMLLIIITYLIISYIAIIKLQDFLFRIYRKSIKFIYRFWRILNKLIASRVFQILFFPLSLTTIIIIDLFLFLHLEETILLIVIGLILSYGIFVFQFYLFLRGFSEYRIKNEKQNYFYLSIFVPSLIIAITIMIGDWHMAIYILHTKFLTYLIFFNLIIIQNNYFYEFMKKKKTHLIMLLILFLFLGTFYSLRVLSFG